MGVSFQELSDGARGNALTGMLFHLRENLGPLEGLGVRYDPMLIEYYVHKLKPLFSADGSMSLVSTLYNPLSSRIYRALYEGYRRT